MSESARRTISGHNKKRIGLAAIAAVTTAIMMMMSYAIPTQQPQFAMAIALGPGPITDGDIGQSLAQKIIDRTTDRVQVILDDLGVDTDLAKVLPPPPPPPGSPEYCYDYDRGTEGGGTGTVCFTNMEACQSNQSFEESQGVDITRPCYERPRQ